MGLTKKNIIEEDKIKIILDIDDIVSKVTLKDPVKRNNIPNQNFALLRNVSDLSCASPVKTDHYAIIIAHRDSSLKTYDSFLLSSFRHYNSNCTNRSN